MEGHTRRFAVNEYSNSAPSAQETNMFRAFSQIVISGQLEPKWGESVLKTQQVLDACLQSARADGKRRPAARLAALGWPVYGRSLPEYGRRVAGSAAEEAGGGAG